MSDCSTHAFDVPMSNRYTHRFGDAQWHEPKKYDEFPGMKRIERIAFTDGTMLDVDYPFVAADREIERVEIDGVEYVDAPRLLEANGKLCAEVNELQAALNAAFDLTSECWMKHGAYIAQQRERIEELEEELADEKAENGWAREFLNTIGPRCGKPDCRSLVDYVSQLKQLVSNVLSYHEPDCNCLLCEDARRLGIEV